jgi:hypothetical protein
MTYDPHLRDRRIEPQYQDRCGRCKRTVHAFEQEIPCSHADTCEASGCGACMRECENCGLWDCGKHQACVCGEPNPNYDPPDPPGFEAGFAANH